MNKVSHVDAGDVKTRTSESYLGLILQCHNDRNTQLKLIHLNIILYSLSNVR